eukprot:4484649-Pleurochrysis_carterae.AAC.2
MQTCGAVALISPSFRNPARDGRPCPLSAPVLEPPRRCAQPRACARSPTVVVLVLIVILPSAPDGRSRPIPSNIQLRNTRQVKACVSLRRYCRSLPGEPPGLGKSGGTVTSPKLTLVMPLVHARVGTGGLFVCQDPDELGRDSLSRPFSKDLGIVPTDSPQVSGFRSSSFE